MISFLLGFCACYLITAALYFVSTAFHPEFRDQKLVIALAALTWPVSFFFMGDDL